MLKIQAPTLAKAKARIRKWMGASAVKRYRFKRGAKHKFKTKKGYTYNWILTSKKKAKKKKR